MESDGDAQDVYWPVGRSYGRSPALDYANHYAYFVSSGGGADNYSNANWDSCGNNYSKKIFSFRSPYVGNDYSHISAYDVYQNGDVGYDSIMHWDSCGYF